MVMKIAVASQNHETITEHTGHCRWFWIYEVMGREVDDKILIDIPTSQTFHNQPGKLPDDLRDISVLISGGMGRSLVQRLAQFGIEALVTPKTDPDVAVEAYLVGKLVTQAPASHEPGAIPGYGPHHIYDRHTEAFT
jgi:predicted Fe-Mo cluster-binding NifX family protein